MEVAVIKIGTSLGFEIPATVINDYNLKAGTKVEIHIIKNSKFDLGKKQTIRKGWDAAFAQYAMDGEDNPMLPDFLDLETDALL
jgi:antitoxin component of MazEF toxin-antitoxin module